MKRDKETPTNNKPNAKNADEDVPERPKCGIIMPISAIGTYSSAHWEDVKRILQEAINAAGFKSDLVSETDDTTIIQRTIVHNLYDNPIVVCDVSGKNPNVMFELGIRLTFDKPTVVVKDDETEYSFDTSTIKHVGYPRGLQYRQIVKFQEDLATAVIATYEAGKDPKYSTFLKHFGQFTVPQLEHKEVSTEQFMIARLEELSTSIARLERQSFRPATVPRARMLEIPGAGTLTERDHDRLSQWITQVFPNVDTRIVGGRFYVVLRDGDYDPNAVGRMERMIGREVGTMLSRYEEVPKSDNQTAEQQALAIPE